MASELEFIRQLQRRFERHSAVKVGIGDDGAVLECQCDAQQVVVADMLLDGVHFDLHQTSPFLAGRKAVAVNLSDIAAMASRPTAAFVSIAIPRKLDSPETFLEHLYDGIQELAVRYNFCIAGGDTNSWQGPFAINVTMTGTPVINAAPVLRSTAQPGDIIIITGPLGGSLGSGRHLTFEPRLQAAEWLVKHLEVHSLMDISDGLSIDLSRMMEASRCGAVLHGAMIPIHSDVAASLTDTQRLKHALSDGEDFELLATVKRLPPDVSLPDGLQLFEVGHVTEAVGKIQLEWPDGNMTDLTATGWQHMN